MRTTTLLSALFGILVIGGTAARADTKRPAPAAADAAAATQAAITALAQGPLHDLGGAVEKLDGRLDRLDAGVRQISLGLAQANLPELARLEAATQAAATDLSARQDRLESGLAADQARVTEGAAAADTAIRALRQQQANSDARLRVVQQAWEERADGAVKALAAQISAAEAARKEAASRADAALVLGGSAVAALLAAMIVAAAWIGWRERRALQVEISLAMARMGSEFRQALAFRPPAPLVPPAPPAPPAPESPLAASDWTGLETRLRRLVEWGENGGAAPPRGASPAEHDSEKPTVSAGPLAEPAVASRLLWPADFLDPESPLSRWRFLLEGHLADDEHPALLVLTHLLGVRALLRTPAAAAPGEVATALFRLSESLHSYWHSLAELSAEDRQQASSAWLQGIRALMEGAAQGLDLREVRPGARVDPDLMHPVAEGPGNHLSVADVFSWAVVDRAGDRFRVLHRAQIAST